MAVSPFAAIGGGAAPPEDEQAAKLKALGAPQGGPPPPPQGGAPNLGAFGAPQGGAPPPAAGPVGAPAGGTPAPAPPAPPAAPAAAPAPEAAAQQLMAQFKTKFGRDMSPAEQAEFQKRVGYSGGAVTPEMMTQGAGLINQYSGNMGDYGAAGTPAAAAPTGVAATNDLAQKTLQDILKQGDTFDPNNPAAQAQRSQFDRVNSRETGRQRMAAAERRAASGELGSGGFDADIAGAEQAQGDRASGFESQLMTQELSAQRQKVQSALQMAVQSGDQNAARQLQEKLGTMDLDLRGKLGKGQLNLGLLNAMLGDKQQGNALGLGYFNAQNNANLGLLNAMGGLE